MTAIQAKKVPDDNVNLDWKKFKLKGGGNRTELKVYTSNGVEVPDYEGFATDVLGDKTVTYFYKGKRKDRMLLGLSDIAKNTPELAIKESINEDEEKDALLEKFKNSRDTSGVDYKIKDWSDKSNTVKITPSVVSGSFSENDIFSLNEWLRPYGFNASPTTNEKGQYNEGRGVLNIIAKD